MSNEYTGEVIHIYPEKVFDSGFKKRDLVLQDKSSQYPQEVPFTFIKDHCDKLDDLELGDVVTVKYDLEGRAWNDRHFPTIRAWKMDVVSKVVHKTANVTGEVPDQEPVEDAGVDEDIPF